MSIRLASRGAATTRMTGTIRDSIRHTLEGRLGYRFQSEALLVQALTHRSYGRQHNERLEFLGDSVLNCAVASLLYARFADSPEGALSRLRANLVKQDPLHDIACGLSLPDALILGEGERKSGGHRRPSILADAVEALLGAIFLESGFAAAAGVVERLYQPLLDAIDPHELGKDAKTRLQEYLQGHRLPLPRYQVVATHGQAHDQRFDVACQLDKPKLSFEGSGESRRKAEQVAARAALEHLLRHGHH